MVSSKPGGINDCSTTAPGSACELMDMPLLVLGAAITVGGGLAGILMIRKRDEATVEAISTGRRAPSGLVHVRGTF